MSRDTTPIRTEPRPACHVCGSEGRTRYEAMTDRLFGVEGTWTLKDCPDCGLIWPDPMPATQDLGRLYERYYTHTPSRRAGDLRSRLKHAYWTRRYTTREQGAADRTLGTAVAAQPLLAAWLDNMVFRLPVIEDGRLLEIGCGSGETLRRLRDLGWDTCGIDFDAKAIALAKMRGLDVATGDLHSQAFPTDHFDAVVMNHVQEHVPDPRALLAEVWRILTPGGTFVSITPNSDSALHVRFGRHWLNLDPPRHLHVFGLRSAKRLLAEQGWDVTVRSTFANSHGIVWASAQLRDRDHHDMETRPGRLAAIGCRLWQAWTAVRASDREGDELVIVATKPAGAGSTPDDGAAAVPR